MATYPMHRTQPEEDWVQAHDSGAIPPAVFNLYARASYLSFGTAPPFLADEDKILFSYFGMLLNGLKESLVDAENQLRLFIAVQDQIYDPGKQARGEPWAPDANERARHHFKLLVLSLQGALDAFADLVGMFFSSRIKGLRLGRAQFSQVEAWLSTSCIAASGVVNPQEHFLEELHDKLRPLAYPEGPERDWLSLMRLFRNKLAHLGNAVFRHTAFHDKAGRFHTFLLRKWPFFWEKYITSADTRSPRVAKTPPPFEEMLIHQDIITYAEGLRTKVSELIEAGASVLSVAYEQFKDFPCNSAALAELNRSSEACDFEYFPATADEPSENGSRTPNT